MKTERRSDLARDILEHRVPCRALAYAESVISGERVAGPYIRAACKRHLDDLERGWERGIAWDHTSADEVLQFFPNALTLTGQSEGDPFVLAPWQEFVLSSLYGWKRRDTGRRRFKYAYVETAKGSGKTPMAAGIALYMLLADRTPRAEVYISAANLEQSKITMRDIMAMVEYSDWIKSQVKLLGGDRMEVLKHPSTGSELRALPYNSKGTGYSGLRPHCAIIDELHEHLNGIMLDRMTSGFKSDPEPLCFIITNSGSDKLSACYEEREKAVRAVSSDPRHDNRFGYVCSLDEGDEPFENPKCWPKANPGMQRDGGGIPGTAYIRDRVNDAAGSPSTMAKVRQLNFCEWTEGETSWLEPGLWNTALRPGRDLRWADYEGKACYGGLDLSLRRAFTSLVLVFDSPHPEYKYDVFGMFWMAGGRLLEAEIRDHREGVYQAWSRGTCEDDTYLRVSPGGNIDYVDVARTLAEIGRRFDVRGIAYDRHYISVLEMEFRRMTEPPQYQMIVHPQAFGAPAIPEDAPSTASKLYMPLSVKQTEILLRQQKLRVAPNPILTSHVASAEARTGVVSYGLDPERSDEVHLIPSGPVEFIDGAVALVQAVGLAESKIVVPADWVFSAL